MRGGKKWETKKKINNRLKYSLIFLGILTVLAYGIYALVVYTPANHDMTQIFYSNPDCDNTLGLFQDGEIKCLNNKTLKAEFLQGLDFEGGLGTGKCGFILTNSQKGSTACTANPDKKNCYHMVVSDSINSQPPSSSLSSNLFTVKGCGYTASSNSNTYSYCCEAASQSEGLTWSGTCGDGLINTPNSNGVNEQCDFEGTRDCSEQCGTYSCSNCQIVSDCYSCRDLDPPEPEPPQECTGIDYEICS